MPASMIGLRVPGLIGENLRLSNAGVWPGDDELSIDGVKYTTLASAVAAASSGDTIYVGIGTFTADSVTIPSGVNLVGADPDGCIFQTSTSQECLEFAGSNYAYGFTAQNTASDIAYVTAIEFDGNNVVCRNVKAIGSNAHATGFSYGFYHTDETGIELWDCIADTTGGGGGSEYAYRKDTTAGGTCKIIRGYYTGANAGIYNDQASGKVNLFWPTVANDIAGGGDIDGWYIDNADCRIHKFWDNATIANTGGGSLTLTVDDADFIVQDTTDVLTNFIWRDHSTGNFYLGTANAAIRFRSTITFHAGGGAVIDEFSTDDTLSGDSDTALPTEQAVKAYVDNRMYALDAYQTAAQTIASGAPTKLLNLPNEAMDTRSWFDAVTNYTLQPDMACNLFISGRITIEDLGDGKYVELYIVKNSTVVASSRSYASVANADVGVSVSCVVDFNGSTDTVELRVLHDHGANRDTAVGQRQCGISACFADD